MPFYVFIGSTICQHKVKKLYFTTPESLLPEGWETESVGFGDEAEIRKVCSILVPLALFASLSRWGLGTRQEGRALRAKASPANRSEKYYKDENEYFHSRLCREVPHCVGYITLLFNSNCSIKQGIITCNLFLFTLFTHLPSFGAFRNNTLSS